MPTRTIYTTYSHRTAAEVLAYAEHCHERDSSYASGFGALYAWVESLQPVPNCAWCGNACAPVRMLNGHAYCCAAHRRKAAESMEREISARVGAQEE